MKKNLSKKEVKDKVEIFFTRQTFTPVELKKIKKLAMSQKIRLGEYRKLFCKKCLSKLKGKTRISKDYKSTECSSCGFKNRFKI